MPSLMKGFVSFALQTVLGRGLFLVWLFAFIARGYEHKSARATIATRYPHSSEEVQALVGNVILTEGMIGDKKVSCTFHFENYTEGVRYRISFFSLPKKLLTSPIQTYKSTYGQPLYLIHNGTLETNKWTAMFDRTSASLTKGDPQSVIGRSIAVASCPKKYISEEHDRSVCMFRSSGVVGKTYGNATGGSYGENMAGGSHEAVPYTKLANAVCYFYDPSSNAEGTLIIKQKIGSPGHNIWVEMNSIPNGGGLHGLRLHHYADLSVGGKFGSVYDTDAQNKPNRNSIYYNNRLHGFPCAPERRLGDLGNIRSSVNGNGYYRGIFRKPLDFLDLVGGACVLYSKGDMPCEVWDEGCEQFKSNYNVVARGVIGVAKSTLTVAKMNAPPNFDCSTTLTVYGRAQLRPFLNSSFAQTNNLEGTVEFFNSDSGSTPGTTEELSMHVSIFNLPDGHKAHYGLGVLAHGDPRVADHRNVQQDEGKVDHGDAVRFNPFGTMVHGRPPNHQAVGDLGNLQPNTIDKSINIHGTVKQLISFRATSDASISLKDTRRSIIGRMFVVYESPDDGTQPNGNVGKPMLWGVIGIGMPASVGPTAQMVNSAVGASSSPTETYNRLVCKLISSNARAYVTGRVEISLLSGVSNRNLEINATLQHLKPMVPYQLLLFTNGDDRGGMEHLGKPLVDDSLYEGQVPACDDESRYFYQEAVRSKQLNEEAKAVGDFGVFQSTSTDLFFSLRQTAAYTGLSNFAGKACAVIELNPYPASNPDPKIAGSGVLGYASQKYRATPTASVWQERHGVNLYDRRCNFSANETGNVPVRMKTIVERRVLPAEDAVFIAIGVTLFVIALATGIPGYVYVLRKKRQLEVEGPSGAVTIEKGPPPPPVPVPHGHGNGSNYFENDGGSVHMVNPLFSAKQRTDGQDKVVELVNLRAGMRRRNGDPRPLPRHPSQKHFGAGFNSTKSFYNPKRLDKHRSQRAVNIKAIQSVRTMKSMRGNMEKDHMGRSFLTLPDRNGRLRHVAIGAPVRRRRILPPHPSRKNVLSTQPSKPSIPAPHQRTQANRKRASTIVQEKRKRMSKAEAMVGWDQLKIGVRSSMTGAFVDSDGEEFQFEDSDYEYQDDDDSDEGKNASGGMQSTKSFTGAAKTLSRMSKGAPSLEAITRRPSYKNKSENALSDDNEPLPELPAWDSHGTDNGQNVEFPKRVQI